MNSLILFAVGCLAGYMYARIGYFQYEADRGNRPMKVKTKTTPVQEMREGCQWKMKALAWSVGLIAIVITVIVWTLLP